MSVSKYIDEEEDVSTGVSDSHSYLLLLLSRDFTEASWYCFGCSEPDVVETSPACSRYTDVFCLSALHDPLILGFFAINSFSILFQ